MKRIHIAYMIAVIIIASVNAQNESKEIQSLKLQLREANQHLTVAENSYKKAESEYSQAKALYEKGLYSKLELAKSEELFHSAKLGFNDAEIALEKTRLNFLNDALYISLEKAMLYRDKDGYKHASITIKNGSNSAKLIGESDQASPNNRAGLLSIDNITIKILKDGKIIGRPFEYKIPVLPINSSRTIDFILQRETEDVSVELSYSGKTVVLPVFLEKDSREDLLLIQSTQFSQEGELSGKVVYDLNLERFSDLDADYTLSILNLPDIYAFEFKEYEGKSAGAEKRISRIRFSQGVTSKSIQLLTNLPAELGQDQLNKKIQFFVLVLNRFSMQKLSELKASSQGKELDKATLDSAKLSFETLELVPRGRPEIDIIASNFFTKVKHGEPVRFSFVLKNSGSVKLSRVRVRLTTPLDWTTAITPEKDITLDVEQKQQIEIEAIPSLNVVPGDYEIKVEAGTLHEGRDVQADSKVMRIELEGKSNLLFGVILSLFLVGSIVGVAILTIKISRR